MPALFVYWKLAPEQLSGALDAVRDFQAGLVRRHPALATGLYQRADAGAAMVTLMETYTQPAGLDAQAVHDIVGGGLAALAAWCPDGRHVEQFDRLDL